MNSKPRLTTATFCLLGATLLGPLSGCVVPADPAARQARETLESIKADPKVTQYAPAELATATAAVIAAERPQPDKVEAAHSAYVAQVELLTARLRAQARADVKAADELNARRDAMRHGNDSITTLATDAFNATPKAPKLVAVGANTPLSANLSGDTPPPALPTPAPPPIEAAAIPSEEIIDVPPVDIPAGPAILLPASAFSGNQLNGAGRAALDQHLAMFAQFPNRMLIISAHQAARVSAVRDYLAGKGLPLFRLAQQADTTANHDGEVRIEFGGATPG